VNQTVCHNSPLATDEAQPALKDGDLVKVRAYVTSLRDRVPS